MLQTMGFPGVEEYAEFADRCWASLFQPGACGEGCDVRNFACLAQEVTQVCCTADPGGCPDGVPRKCDFECSIKLRPFLDTCDDALLASQLSADTLGQLRAAGGRCVDQNPDELLNHLYELKEEQQCTVDLSAIADVGGAWHAGTEDGRHEGECSEIQEAIVRRCIANCDECNMAPTLVVVGTCTGYQANGDLQAASDLIASVCSGDSGGGGAKSSVPVVTVVSTSAIPTYVTYQLSVNLPATAANLYNINGSPTNPMQIPAAFQVDAPFGVDIGGTNQALWSVNPQTQYDSWLTVGVTDGSSAGVLSTAGVDFASWTDKNVPINSVSGAVQYLNPQDGPTNQGEPIIVAQLTLHDRHKQRATINLKGKDHNGADWQLDGIVFEICNGASCGGAGHRRQMQLSQWTHGSGATCDWDTFDQKAEAMDAQCCPNGDCSSTNGVPAECGLDCAVLFSNTYNNCHDTLDSVVGESMPLFDHFVERCYQLVSAHEIQILTAVGAADCPDGDAEPGSG
eukprot:COSAG02_NODE_827_length_16704_cov_8.649322_13_plen_512_part_00